jgi:hypothetical protein
MLDSQPYAQTGVRRPSAPSFSAAQAVRLLILIGAAFVVALLLSQPLPGHRIDLGAPGLERSFYPVEQADQLQFRQSRPTVRLILPLIDRSGELQLTVSGNQAGTTPVSLRIGARPLTVAPVTPGFRSYHLLLPEALSQESRSLTLDAPPFQEQNASGRQLGVAVERIGLRSLTGRSWLLPQGRLFVRVLALLLCGYGVALLARARARRWLALAAIVLLPTLIWLRLAATAGFVALLSLLLAGSLLALLSQIALRLAARSAPAPVQRRAPAATSRLVGWRRAALEAATLAGWIGLALIMTYPLVTQLGSAFPDKLDSYLNSWILAWDHYQLWRSPLHLFDTNILYPYPKTLAQSEHLLGLYPLTGPLLAIGLSPAVVHNLAIVLAFALCGYGMWLLVLESTGSRTAALVAGCIYAFYPYRILQMAHLQQVSAQWMPFTFWALERFRRSGSWKAALGAAIFFLLQSLVSYYHAIFLGVLVAVYGVFFLVRDPQFRAPRRLLKLAAVSPLILIVHLPLALPYLQLQRELGFQRSLKDSFDYAAALTDYLAPFGVNRLYDGAAAALSVAAPIRSDIFSAAVATWPRISGRPTQETLLFVGVLPVVLALIGGVAFRRRRIVQCMLIGLGLCFVLSLGPALRLDWRGDPLLTTMPYSYLPVTRVIRAPARFALIEIVALALLASFGVVAIQRWLERRAAPLVVPTLALLALLVAGELTRAPIRLYPIVESNAAVERWLMEQPVGLTLHLPAGDIEREARYELATTPHFRPMMNGYSGYADLPTLGGYLGLLHQQFTQRDLTMLQGLGLRYLVLHRDMLDQQERRMIEAQLSVFAGARRTATLPDADIYELAADPWIDQIAARLGPDGTLYVGGGGSLPEAYPRLAALRFYERVTAGRTSLGYRQLSAAPSDQLPTYGLFGSDEDPTPAGYRAADVVWQNELFKLIRRPGS